MKKKVYKSKRAQQRKREIIFFGVLIGLLILGAVLGIIERITDDGSTRYTVTEDGHIYAADGTLLGTLDEVLAQLGDGTIITEDGHLHAADGTHLGNVNEEFEQADSEPAESEDAEQTEGDNAAQTEGAAE